MSFNGDVMVMRNGRSTSTVSIYNYPEHLNPFYEDDQHKRLRFWPISKKGDENSRRNSFSLGGIKDMWAFKSFRSKKKSSTLGINKTSESPPPMRRDYQMESNKLFNPNDYDHRARYSSNDGNKSFPRNAPYRSSLQNLQSDSNGFGLNRNDQYRSTIQFGPRTQLSNGQVRPVPQPRRYVYGGSVTPQPSRSSEFSKGLPKDTLSRGSSRTSVNTNPFDSDNDEENEQHFESENAATSLDVKRTPRKKRRAPAPPVPIHSNAKETASHPRDHYQQELRIEENLEIANLTAEIENFVKNQSDDASEKKTETINASKTNGTVPKKKIVLQSSPNMIITKQFNAQTKSSNTDLQIVEDVRTETKPALPEKKRINMNVNANANVNKIDTNHTVPSEECGHVECIHVHVDSPRTTPERTLPSRVTSFKKDGSPASQHIIAKTSFTLTTPPSNRRNNVQNDLVSQTPKESNTTTSTTKTAAKTIITTTTKTTKTEKQNCIESDTPAIVKPPIASKPTLEHQSKVNQNFAVIHKPTKHIGITTNSNEVHENTLSASTSVPAPVPTSVKVSETKTKESKAQTHSKETINLHLKETSSFPEKNQTTEQIKPIAAPKLGAKQKHVVFQDVDPKIKVSEFIEHEKKTTEINQQEVQIPKSNNLVTAVNAKIAVTSNQATNLPTSTSNENQTLSSPSVKVVVIPPTPLHIEEPPNISNEASSSTVSALPRTSLSNSRDEFEALYRHKPNSHLEWKQTSLATLETRIPPEKRRSVKDIIESINRSQRLLHAAAHKDELPLLSTTIQAPPPSYNEIVNNDIQTRSEANDLSQNLNSLDETQREIERIFEEITSQDTSEPGPSSTVVQNTHDTDVIKPNNEDVFKKSRVTKEVYDYRESSPTTSNLDWNPVPKPKRSKNLSDQYEN